MWTPPGLQAVLRFFGFQVKAARCRVGILTQHIRPHRSGGDEPRIMTELLQPSRPVVCAAARFHHNSRRCASSEELEKLCTLWLESFDLAGLRVERMKLKYLLGNVHSDKGGFHFRFSLTRG
jgi:hypothetical protein